MTAAAPVPGPTAHAAGFGSRSACTVAACPGVKADGELSPRFYLVCTELPSLTPPRHPPFPSAIKKTPTKINLGFHLLQESFPSLQGTCHALKVEGQSSPARVHLHSHRFHRDGFSPRLRSLSQVPGALPGTFRLGWILLALSSGWSDPVAVTGDKNEKGGADTVHVGQV